MRGKTKKSVREKQERVNVRLGERESLSAGSFLSRSHVLTFFLPRGPHSLFYRTTLPSLLDLWPMIAMLFPVLRSSL